MRFSSNILISICLYVVAQLILQSCPNLVQAKVYRVGPKEPCSHLRQIKWDSLKPGDVVEILYKLNGYREKFFLLSSGTKARPITLRGVINSKGKRPVIDGVMAVQSQDVSDEHLSKRGLIIIGEEKRSADYIVIENLELRNANNKNFFKFGNKSFPYAANGSGVLVCKSKYVKIKNCVIHSCCMGIQTFYYPNVDKFVLTNSIIYNNGDFTRSHWGHNVYLCARKTLVQFNKFGELYSDGNNIKDRSNKTIIRYNWIEGGMSHQIDLVEYSGYPSADAFVYGNVIISGKKTKNSKMILFGGDRHDKEGKLIGQGRNGTLYFFNNTVHFRKQHLDAFLCINKPNCRVLFQNNLLLGGKTIKIGKGWFSAPPRYC